MAKSSKAEAPTTPIRSSFKALFDSDEFFGVVFGSEAQKQKHHASKV